MQMHSYATAPQQVPMQPTAPFAFPSFGNLEVSASPLGFVVRPRTPAMGWLIEAVVWVIAACIAGAMVLFETGTIRAIGALVVFSIGIRAFVRTMRFVTAKFLRSLSVDFRTPAPRLSGSIVGTPMASIARFAFETDRGDRYFCALDTGGRVTHLVAIEPSDEGAYRALAAWLVAQGFVRPGAI